MVVILTQSLEGGGGRTGLDDKHKPKNRQTCYGKLLQDDILLLKIALAQLQKLLTTTDPAASVKLRDIEEVENSFSLDLSFSTRNVRMRRLSEIRKAAAKISKFRLQLGPQPLIQLITCLCSQVYQLIPRMLSSK